MLHTDLTKKQQTKVEDFPSNEIFIEERQNFVDSRTEFWIKNLLNNKNLTIETFAHLNKDKLELLAKSIANFEFGIILTHKRMGREFDENTLTIEVYDPDFLGAFFQRTTRDENGNETHVITLRLDPLLEFLTTKSIQEEIFDQWEIPPMNIDDLMFVLGVEESAHFFWMQKSNKKVQIEVNPLWFLEDSPSRHKSDAEFRAIQWKVHVVKKYFPTHAEAFEKFYVKNKALRDIHLTKRK